MSLPSTLRLKQKPNQNLESSVKSDSNQINQEVQDVKESITEKKLPSTLKLKKQKDSVVFPFEGENDLDREIERSIAQGTSRIGESILGLPGDLSNFVRGLFGDESETNLPTSKSLREKSEKYSLGYTKPKTDFEERGGELLQDIASFMLPGSGKYNFVRNIGIPVVANLAKEGIKYSGNEKLGEAAKIGTMVVLDLMSLRNGGAKKYAGELFNQSEKLIPEGTALKSPTFEKSLLNLEKSLSSGGSAPSKEKALKKVSEIQSKMNNGEIEVKELIDFRKSINEIKSELGGFEVQLPKHIKKKAIANLDLVKNEVVKSLDEYGSKFNPEFHKLNRSANESWAAYENSDRIANFIKKNVSKAIKSTAVKTLFGLSGVGVYMYPAAAAKLGASAIPLYAAHESYKVLHQVMKSPTLRKYYGNILKGAASGNASQVSKNIKALDKEFEEDNL